MLFASICSIAASRSRTTSTGSFRLEERPLEGIEQVVETVAEPQIELGLSIHDRPETHDECCRVNAALRSRLNRLQHALDTKRYTTV